LGKGQHLSLSTYETEKKRLPESDVQNPKDFHRVPDHLKEILYLDASDLIVEQNGEPIFSAEISEEAGTGHNAFQRFPRIAAAVEAEIPTFYIYPEATFVKRESSNRWDELNPLILRALESAMQIHDVPALLYYYPSEFDSDHDPPKKSAKGLLRDDELPAQPDRSDGEMSKLFEAVDRVIDHAVNSVNRAIIKERPMRERRNWMQTQFARKDQGKTGDWSPLTSVKEVDTEKVVNTLKEFNPGAQPELFEGRDKTIIYSANAKIRGDPYTGALAAIDYLKCRVGPTYEERDKNLVFSWGTPSIEDGKVESELRDSRKNGASIDAFTEDVQRVTKDNNLLLGREFDELSGPEIPRYYMQVRHGTRFTQKKLIRCFAYFADGLLFHDGALWREG